MEVINNINNLEFISKRIVVFQGRQYHRQIALPNHKLYYSEFEQHVLEFKRTETNEKQFKAYYSIHNPAAPLIKERDTSFIH